jgi:hypothetical protein
MKMRQLVAMLALAATPVAAQQRPVAVTPFETEGSAGLSRDEYDALGRALGAVLATELDERRDGAVSSLALAAGGRAGRVDMAAARAGAASAKAAIVVVATLLDQYGDIHLEARVLDATTGASLLVVRGDTTMNTRERVGEAVADLAGRLVKDPIVGGAPEARWRRALPVAALMQFGRGLRLEQAGSAGEAAAAYRAALAAAPTLVEAKAALTRVGG